ncbi:MAG TPA: HAD family phosphatase [Solirubrobacterales bacterium]|nr:HAD family phosphatase [Solirubrobacterales bacterium]
MAAASAAQLVIFDCDGVLVDTEPISNRILAAAISEAGLPIAADEVKREFEAMRLTDIQVRVEERLGRPLGDAWLGDFEARREAAFREGIEPIPGVEEVLRALSAEGRPFCAASQARLEKTELTLGLTGLRRYFEDGALFASTMVVHGKPAPDLFLHAAGAMGFEPADCVVVEDAVPGVRAARAAGMPVFGYAPEGTGDRLAAAGARVFDSMDELPSLLVRTGHDW